MPGLLGSQKVSPRISTLLQVAASQAVHILLLLLLLFWLETWKNLHKMKEILHVSRENEVAKSI